MLIIDLFIIVFDMIMSPKCSAIWQQLNKLQYIFFVEYNECIKSIALCHFIKIAMIQS